MLCEYVDTCTNIYIGLYAGVFVHVDGCVHVSLDVWVDE